MKILQIYGLVLISLLLITGCKDQATAPKTDSPIAQINLESKDTTWKTLSLREKIGQTMIIRAYYNDQIQQFGSIDSLLKKYPVGGLYVPFWEYLGKVPDDQVLGTIKSNIKDYQTASKYPLFVTEDFERGVGSVYKEYTHMPVEMSLGAANNPDLAYRYGNAIAKESADLGINWLLHPLTDLNMNPLQDLVIERSISDDPDRALPLLQAQVKGINAQNVIATIKHFPGDGATMRNQHFVTSSNNLSFDEWQKSFGKIYDRFIQEDIDCIMCGHIRFPAYQKQKLNGVLPPASLSNELINGLLKRKMKFRGVVMSDALNMGGAAGYYDNELETSVAAFAAGIDMVLWPKLAYLDTIEARIKRGDIPMSRLNDAVKRIWRLREKHQLLTKQNPVFYPLSDQDEIAVKNTGKAVAEAAVTLLSDSSKIPLKPDENKHLLIVNISYNSKVNQLQYTQSLLEKKGFVVDTIMHNPKFFDWDRNLAYFNQFDKIIVAMENKYFDPLGAAMFKGDEAAAVWTMNMLKPEKIIAISYSNPYYVNFYFENAYIKINAYSLDDFTQKAVVDALTGAIPFKGSSPVKINPEILN